jgi:hypothetical protein
LGGRVERRGGLVSVGLAGELDVYGVFEDEGDRVVQQRSEAIADPSAAVRRSEDDETLLGELDCPQWLQPCVVGGLTDGERELVLYPRPYVLELSVHGSVYRPGSGRVVHFRQGAREGPVGRLYPTPFTARWGSPQMAENFSDGLRKAGRGARRILLER